MFRMILVGWLFRRADKHRATLLKRHPELRGQLPPPIARRDEP
jgi:hypothetical protein